MCTKIEKSINGKLDIVIDLEARISKLESLQQSQSEMMQRFFESIMEDRSMTK